jgi:hypothetical protein
VIDLARLLSGFCADLIDNDTFFDALFRAAELSIDNGTSSSSKAKETNALLVLRTVANALQEGTSTSDNAWVEKVHFQSVRVTSWFLNTTTFFLDLWNSRRSTVREIHERTTPCTVDSALQVSAPFPQVSTDDRCFLHCFYSPLAGADWVEQLFLHDTPRGC